MGNGDVDEQWAHEHHGLWLEEVEAREPRGDGVAPAE
jgi:formate dehydrogenase subunit gamma